MNPQPIEQSTSRPLAAHESRHYEPFSAEEMAGSVWGRLLSIAHRFRHRPALLDGDRTTTYGELLQLVAAYAACLSAAGAECGRRAPVALLTRDPLQRLAGMGAALRMGRPFLPLDPAAPAGRLQLILRDSGATVVVTDDSTQSALSLFDGLIVDSPAADRLVLDCDVVEADAPALLLYTSGSTGRPKRVVQQHRMILDSLSCYSESLRIAPDDRLSLLASPGFGEAWNDVFLALFNGAAICVHEAKSHGTAGLAEWLAASRITVLHCVPTLLRALSARHLSGILAPDLRIVNLGGEAVSRTDVRLCHVRLNPECIVVNSYGSTETKLIAQYFIDRETILDAETVPVGRPRRGVEVHVLGVDGTPVPAGEVGEIEVCSPSVVQGYEANEPAGESRFQRDDSARTRYRTGDLGRFNARGLLEYLGRQDQMVKLRGYRIELSEIECLLQSHPDVQQAVVVVHETSSQIRQLVAVYQSRDDVETRDEEFRRYLGERLPDYMLPSRYVRLDQLPLIDSGKPDRRWLLELISEGKSPPHANGAQVAKVRGLVEHERRLMRLVSEVLQIDDIAMDAGFVELGGDSLNVTELLVRINHEFGRTLTPQSVFEARTLSEIAEKLRPPGAG